MARKWRTMQVYTGKPGMYHKYTTQRVFIGNEICYCGYLSTIHVTVYRLLLQYHHVGIIRKLLIVLYLAETQGL